MPHPHDPGPHWGEVGIHGLHRHREWDEVTSASIPGLSSDKLEFVVLGDGRIALERGAGADAAALARALSLTPPYRARCVRRNRDLWALAARRIVVAALVADPAGNDVELAWDGETRSVRVDGVETTTGFPELERLAAARHRAYVVRARRLLGRTWEVSVSPL